jgi:hypothetical protein
LFAIVIPGMNAIAFTREVRSAAQLHRWLARLEGWEPAVFVPSFETPRQKRGSSG